MSVESLPVTLVVWPEAETHRDAAADAAASINATVLILFQSVTRQTTPSRAPDLLELLRSTGRTPSTTWREYRILYRQQSALILNKEGIFRGTAQGGRNAPITRLLRGRTCG